MNPPKDVPAAPGDAAFLAEEARRHDPDRYLCALFAPAERRDALLGLLLFNQELARIPELVSQPMAGMIRYQWWREAVTEAAQGRPRAHPVVRALAAPLREARLDPARLLALVDARESELDALAPADLAALEAYAGNTAGALQAAAVALLGGAGTAWEARARLVGTAFGLVGILRAVAFQSRRQRVLLPEDLLGAAAVSPAEVMAASARAGLARVFQRITERADALLDEAGRNAPRVPRELSAALLPAVPARWYARRLGAVGGDPARAAELHPPASMPLRLLGAYLRGRV
ncbi:MAG TPA: squalene/phytoene synthase family protein [Geminicoccaceae bacterium]|nr:squalene/phytoene synthase family protein [Geminicoccaceae bacterium]